MIRRLFALGLGLPLLAGCAQEVADPGGHELPEANVPLSQKVEAGPLAEGSFSGAELAAFTEEEGWRVSSVLTMPGPVSRASALRFGGRGAVEVQAGWSNGMTGPWRPLTVLGTAGAGAVLAGDLETAATTLRFRIAPEGLAELSRLDWVANVPLEPAARSDTLPDPSGAPAEPRSAWGAGPAHCGSTDTPLAKITVYRLPGAPEGVPVPTYLSLRQALAQGGLQFCDLRPSYLVGAETHYLGRGDRRPAYLAAGSDQGRAAVAVLGCQSSASSRAQLLALLGPLVARLGLGPEAVEIGPSPACAEDDPQLTTELAAWKLAPPPEPEPEPEPEPVEARIAGRVWDASTGDAQTGTGLGGVTVSCACGSSASTDATGHYQLAAPAGSQSLTFAKSGYDSELRTVTAQAGVEASVDLGLTPTAVPNPGVSVIDHAYLIQRWGGPAVDPLAFPETQDGFQAYLDAVGVVHFAAWEYVVPNNSQVAASCGYTLLLPERAWWPKAAALGLLADQLRDLVAEPVTLRNWWRPDCYNSGVGGAAGGDHPDADALDLDFRSARSRADAQRLLCETYWKRDLVEPADIAPGSNLNPRLNLSVGLGGATIHLGLLSRNGRRFWKYDSYSAQSNSGDCW